MPNNKQGSRILTTTSSERIFRKNAPSLCLCGGVPLAIITSAGTLLGRASDGEHQVVLSEQQLINGTVLSELVKLDESQATRKILDICYVRRSITAFEVLSPVHGYLSRNDYEVKKDRLIRRWLAEWLVQLYLWQTREELVRNSRELLQFDELVSTQQELEEFSKVLLGLDGSALLRTRRMYD